MLLTIDVGNTNMVFSVFDGETLTGSFRLTTVAGRTSDELGMDIWNQLSRLEIRPADLEDVIISSVVPPVMAALADALVRYLDKAPVVVDVDVDPGLPYGVESNEHLGADRSVACVAAIHKYGAPLILADMGTATTVDAIGRTGAYLGGCITAGARISIEALFQKTALLPQVDLALPERVLSTVDAIGRTGAYLGGCITAGARISIEALFQKTALLPQVDLALPERVLSGTAVGQIQAGAVLGYVGAMERLITQAREEINEPEAIVVATGGLAPVIAAGTDLIDVVDGQLIPEGCGFCIRNTCGSGSKREEERPWDARRPST